MSGSSYSSVADSAKVHDTYNLECTRKVSKGWVEHCKVLCQRVATATSAILYFCVCMQKEWVQVDLSEKIGIGRMDRKAQAAREVNLDGPPTNPDNDGCAA
eukprot:11508726-Karenia_brevis.AAC.1